MLTYNNYASYTFSGSHLSSILTTPLSYCDFQKGVTCAVGILRNIPGLSQYRGTPGILRQGGDLHVDTPGYIPGSSQYPRTPEILRQWGDLHSGYSQVHPGIVMVSRDSWDTQTRG